jgi:redox-sensitive bicupin YhaK (pirin superfamily)
MDDRGKRKITIPSLVRSRLHELVQGILHAEMPVAMCHGLQLWVNLPRSEKMCEPRYQELLDKDIPRINPIPGSEVKVGILGMNAREIHFQVIAGQVFGTQSPVFTKTPIMYLDFKIGANSALTPLLPPTYNAFIYILSGCARFGEDSRVHEAHHSLILSQGIDEDRLEIRTDSSPVHFVLVAGEPLNVGRYHFMSLP